jgi:hypothetical protein
MWNNKTPLKPNLPRDLRKMLQEQVPDENEESNLNFKLQKQ